jgi:hypothetical protein
MFVDVTPGRLLDPGEFLFDVSDMRLQPVGGDAKVSHVRFSFGIA